MATNNATEMDNTSAPNDSPNADTEQTSHANSQKAFLTANVGLTTYRVAQKAHKIGTNVHRIVGAFDPTGTLGDGDDISDSDISMSDSDDDHDDDDDHDTDEDDDSIHSEHSDDESIHSDEDVQDHKTEDNTKSQTEDTSLQPVLGKGASKLPQTRSSKPTELPPTRSLGTSIPVTRDISTAAPNTPKASSSSPVSTAAKETPMNGSPDGPAAAPSPPATEAPPPAPKTQIVKVRKPDGTIVKVRRPIKPATASNDATQEKPTSACIATTETKPNTQPQTEKEPQLTSKEIKSGITVRVTEKLDNSGQEPSQRPETKAEILQRRTSKATQIIVWSIMISFPLFFLILAILTASVNQKPKADPIGLGITQTNKIAVSLWPIAYAAVVAQALRMYASYKVETGMSLMTLEQLISSHSMASAVKQPFLLQRIDRTSIALLCLWSLSPLAGQALLRMSHLEPSGKATLSTLHYLNSSAFPVTGVPYDPVSAFFPMEVDEFLAVAILSPEKTQEEAMDLWGNIKIPAIEPLEGTDVNKTYSIGSSPVYSSLIGIPVLGLPQDNSTSRFSLKSGYFALDCPAMSIGKMSVVNATLADLEISTNLGISSSYSLMLGMVPGAKDSPDVPDTVGKFFFASEIAGTGSDDGSNPDYGYTTCTYKLSHVLSNVTCVGADCQVSQITRVTGPDYDNSLAFQYGTEIDYAFVYDFAHSGSNTMNNTYSLITYYLLDPSTAGHPNLTAMPNLSNVPITTLTTRLSILLNTYWIAGVAPYAINNNLRLNDTSIITQYTDAVTNTTLINKSVNLIYFTSWGWLTILLVASVLLLLGGIAGAICDSRTVGPDIFGFASSLAHRNKYMRVPTGDSTMGGAKRTKMLGHVKVMLQDVKPNHDIGKIALGTVENGGEKLKHGRLYK